MFKKTDTTPQMDLFSNATLHFTERAYVAFTEEKTWFNLYLRNVTSKINEEIFAPLYSDTGAYNMSARLIVSIMILRKALGLNETVMLSEKCLFDLAIRKALGLTSLLDEIPSSTTMHSFLTRIEDYKNENGVDLIQECMNNLLGKKKLHFLINGDNITIDRKFLQEKAVKTPYETIHKDIVLVLKQKDLQKVLPSKLMTSVNIIIRERPQVSITKTEQKSRLKSAGLVLTSVIKKVKPSNPVYERLYNMINTHFTLRQGVYVPKLK